MALFSLLQTRAQIFQTAFNPTSIRTGAKYLRRRVRGPSMLAYYPPKLDIPKAIRMFPDLELVDDDEQTRLEDIEYRRKRGKGPPKKQKEGLLILFISLQLSLTCGLPRRDKTGHWQEAGQKINSVVSTIQFLYIILHYFLTPIRYPFSLPWTFSGGPSIPWWLP